MNRSLLITGILSAVMVAMVLATDPVMPGTQYDVNEMCDNIHCVQGKVCRVLKPCHAWDKWDCEPRLNCVDCVPEAIDRVCNAQGYDYGIAVGNPMDEELLEPLECSNSEPCPRGANCVRDSIVNYRGVCCYGGPHYGHAVTSCNRKCVSCVPSCPPGYTCKQDLTASCGMESSRCVPNVKDGFCSTMKCDGSDDKFEKANPCNHDQECESGKCCEQCNGKKVCSAYALPFLINN